MNRIAPSLRFDNISFSNVVKDGAAQLIYTRYTCPKCGESISFTKEHFFSIRDRKGFSNLPEDVARRFNDWAVANDLSEETFLDWVCPGCRLAVRAYVAGWAGGHHGDSGAEIVAVVEEAPN